MMETETDNHIVDILIEERAHKLRQSRLWPIYKRILYPILGHKPAKVMADAIADKSAIDVFKYLSDLLALDVQCAGVENIPETGRIIIAPTHPTGIPDGIAVWDAIKSVRTDLVYFANRDAIRTAQQLSDMIIPVEWVDAKRTAGRSRETLQATVRAFQNDRCVVLFPSGRIAYMDEEKQLVEQEWLASVAIFARKYDCPIIPIKITMRNSWLYYWFWKINTELRDITLFHELLNKRGKTYTLTIGRPIMPDQLKGDTKSVAEALRSHASNDLENNAPWKPVAASQEETS